MTKVSRILITLAYTLLFQACSTAVAEVAPQTGLAPQAMYSYSADMSDAKPLDGAELTGQTAYVQWSGDYNRAKYYCCKATATGGEVTEAHGDAIEAPVMALDLEALGESEQIRELYTDLYMDDGSVKQGNVAYFAVVEAEAEPAPLPQVDQAAGPVAMYSYSADMSDAKPLDGAELTGQTAYVQWSGDYNRAKYYCCKATASGGEVTEAHGDAIEAPVMVLDLATLGESDQARELYTDLYMDDGSVQQGNVAYFAVAEAAPEAAPEAEPEAEPAPLPQIDQAAGPVAMYSYSADMSNAKPLEGAELTGQTAYVQWSGDYNRAKYYCCKATAIGGEVTEAHGDAIEAPVMVLDLATLGESDQARELYTDLYMDDGSVQQGNVAYFAVAEAAPEAEPEAEPAPLPQVDQAAGPIAMYSYSPDMSDAKPLDGAELTGQTAYVQWSGDYNRAKYYCCKATDTGGEVTEDHGDAIEAPVMELDLAALGDSDQIRELYTDLYMADGSVQQGNVAYFAVAEAAPEPTPLPQVDQAAGPVAMYSYSADMSNAKPLEGAKLTGHTAYVQWSGDYNRAKYYCCKATASGGEVTEAHGDAIEVPIMVLDLATLGESEQIRELYTDLYTADGKVLQNNQAYFTVAEVEPAPVPVTGAPKTIDITIEWSAPSERENGTYLSLGELSGYEIYYTAETSEKSVVILVDGGNVNTFDIDALPADIYHFAVSAIDNDMLKSEMSEIISMDLR